MIINNDSLVRFNNKVNKTDSCWLWTGSTNGVGYGEIRINHKKHYAHRLSYQHYNGDIAKGMEIDHLCRNRSCVNPAHLDQVNRSENMKRAMPYRKDTHKTTCINGHDLADSYQRKDGKGRNCRKCNLDRVKAYQHRQKVAA